MVKIKQKKQLNLPHLIEWAMKNDIKNKDYRANDTAGYISEVYFGVTGLPRFSSMVDKQDTFTVEVEEEITEDTELLLIERYVGGSGNIHYCRYSESSIKNAIESNPSDNKSTHFYIENDDRELILIWRDGKLVE